MADNVPPEESAFYLYLILIVGLVLFAGMMSGLTLGLLSLDQLELKMLISGGSETDKKYAFRILPLLEKEHLLLVTLLLFNALAMEALPICLDRLVDPIVAIAISVTAVLLFGEIIPQGVCSRYGLVIGAYAAPAVTVLIYLAFPIAWPIAKLLDAVLGHGGITFFRKSEFKELIRLHGEQHAITGDEAMMMKGALELQEKTAEQIMTPIGETFMLAAERIFDQKCLEEIADRKHSRIPVYQDGVRERVCGLLVVKTLLRHLPAALSCQGAITTASASASASAAPSQSQPPLRVKDLSLRSILEVPAHMPLDQLLNRFQRDRSHLAIVFRSFDLVGVVTLEDVVEELISEEIYDEVDDSFQRSSEASDNVDDDAGGDDMEIGCEGGISNGSSGNAGRVGSASAAARQPSNLQGSRVRRYSYSHSSSNGSRKKLGESKRKDNNDTGNMVDGGRDDGDHIDGDGDHGGQSIGRQVWQRLVDDAD